MLAVDEDLGFALETQTLTIIGSDIAQEGRGADIILLHELAHQWVGDAVSPATWKDIWLNEGFATYAEWLYTERTGGPTAAASARQYEGSPRPRPAAGRPGLGRAVQPPRVYLRGGMTLQALRERDRRRRLLHDPPHLDRRAPRRHRAPPRTSSPSPSRSPARSSTTLFDDVALQPPTRLTLTSRRVGSQSGRLASKAVMASSVRSVMPMSSRPSRKRSRTAVLQREVDLEADGRRRQRAPVDVDHQLERRVGLDGGEQLLADLGRHHAPARGRSWCSCCGRCRRSGG